MEAAGEAIHGEADLVESLSPASVLDAGCGTGRVSIELARRGIEVVGVDLDTAMLASARRNAPELEWLEGDLVDFSVTDTKGGQRQFDVVALAGNVMIFLAPGTEAEVVANLASHLRSTGRLVAGFQLQQGRLDVDGYDAACAKVGLVLESRWGTWGRGPYIHGGDYAVSVHQRGH